MRLFNQVKILCISLLSVVFSSSVLANTKQATVYIKFSDQEIVKTIKAKYPHTEILRKGLIRISSNGINYVIDNTRNNGSLSFLISFSNKSTSLSDLNKWNRERRFISAYLDEDNDIFCNLI